MKQSLLFFIAIFLLQYLPTPYALHHRNPVEYDFFYFVQMWPGSYCDSGTSCCFMKPGKPAPDFIIAGLWPTNFDGSCPFNCDPSTPFDGLEILDLVGAMKKFWPPLACGSSYRKLWASAWKWHGSCTLSMLDQHGYFQAALNLRRNFSMLRILKNSGIIPNNGFYSFDSIHEGVWSGLGYEPYIECNVDPSGNGQLYRIYFCADLTGSNFIDCPVPPNTTHCPSSIRFPLF